MGKVSRKEFHTALEHAHVDPEAGIIKGVSIITCGVTARGHDLEVDAKTLTQVKACADSMGTVPVKWNHRSGADAVCGYLDNFRIEGAKLLGDWHLLKTHPNFDQAIELAERMPNNIGLSAAFMGQDEKLKGQSFARCQELISVDLVAQPAANPDGLFEAKVDTVLLENMNEPGKSPATEPSLSEILQAVQGVSHEVADMRRQVSDMQSRLQEVEGFQQSVMAAVEHHENQTEDAATPDEENPDAAEDAKDAEAPKKAKQLSARVAALEQKHLRELAAREAATEKELTEAAHAKLNLLQARNQELSAKVEALTTAARTRGASPVSHGGLSERMFSAGAPKVHDFEQNVADLVASGKSKGQAVVLAVKQDPEAYHAFQAAKGIVKNLE
jgi:hypothetical protein